MNVIRVLAGFLVGIISSSLVCWGGLILWGTIALRGKGSLFDTNPTIANAFFICWGALSLICGIAGALYSQRANRRRYG
jgi:hypothetical protein